MDLGRMLEKCRRDQWSVDDLDWSRPPPTLPRDKEEAVCQYFTDMAGIERLAGALFATQARQADDPVLRAIFDSFVVDEERHAVAAERLARYYDVRHLRRYEMNPALVKFRPHFLRVVELMPPEIATAYITAGELMLDVALLRSLDDYVGDQMSHQAMHLINRDESRHIAIDFHMTEKYATDEFLAARARRPKPPLRDRARGWRALAVMLFHAQPFMRGVFLEPMDKTDPGGKRILEAFKRMQLLARKPQLARLPFTRFMLRVQEAFNHPVIGPIFGGLLLRLLGGEARAATVQFTDDELARAQQMSFDELAEDALAVKYS
ncbi:MAG: ferritin-like domain-containing protein [Kofleriaceae bacterium]|nr:ferritin-like domain-containing protein [Myxococcales bacterium]MCB9559089.1 ferritin-like domain-containing protein [Kofleriaceae bacterium]MCB9574818.1 ferritin-like domain-containing protein [Kofleriaceae bacterium]